MRARFQLARDLAVGPVKEAHHAQIEADSDTPCRWDTRRVLGFYSEQSDELAKLPEMLADAQVARWQSKYGRDPTDQQRSWLVSKIRTDIAMMGIKLNAQVTIKNLQGMHEKSLPPTVWEREGGCFCRSNFNDGTTQTARGRMEREYQDWARLQGRGPHTGRRDDRLVGRRMW
jgi:hypothetical protein